MKKSSNSSRKGYLACALIVLLLTIGFITASGCDLGTYKKRYDGPEPKKVEPKDAESDNVEPELENVEPVDGELERTEAPNESHADSTA